MTEAVRERGTSDDLREHYVARFGEAARAEDEPAWLAALRKEAIGRFAEQGFPTIDLEDWRYTNLSRLVRAPREIAPATAEGIDRAEIERLSFPVFACSVYVFVNGRFVPELSAPRALSGEMRAGSLAEALGRSSPGLEAHLGRVACAEEDALVALNTACFADGALVLVPRDVALEAPIHLVHLSVPAAAPTISHPRTLIVVGAGSRAVVIEDFVSLGPGDALTNVVSEVVLEEGASLEHVQLLREHDEAAHLANVRVQQARDSHYLAHGISLGGVLSRTDLRVLQCGPGADTELNGFYVASGRQHVDNHTTIDHARPDGTSREYYKGVLDGSARGVFAGRVIVRPDAQRTSARQTNRNLLLSRDAEVDSKPQLEIHADDVRCSHGSTIGQLDDDALFYMRARGISEDTARALLMRAFAVEITSRIRVPALRDRIDELLLARLLRQAPEAA